MDLFKELLLEMTALLKPFGFTKKGSLFIKQTEGNWALIEFQKSRDSTKSETIFTINLGIASSFVLVFEEKDFQKNPSVSECHWTERIGFISNYKRDHWWKLSGPSDLPPTINEITRLLKELAIPEMLRHISDEALIALWYSGKSNGITDFKRIENLSILVKGKKRAEYEKIINELIEYSKGKSFAKSFQVHLEDLKRIN
jgi:hypothetical protein